MFSPVRPAAANGHFVKNPKPHRRTVFRFTRRQDAERPGVFQGGRRSKTEQWTSFKALFYFNCIVWHLNKINNPNAFQKKRSDYFHMSRNCATYSRIKFNAEYNLITIIGCLHAEKGIVNSLFSCQFAVYSILWNFFIFN